MATYQKFNSFTDDLAEGVHTLATDQLIVALSSAAPTGTDAVLADLTQISYANLSSRNITTTSSTQTAGQYSLVLAPLTLTASGGSVASFRYVTVYNDTAASDNLMFFGDVGSMVTLVDGQSFQITFGSPAFTIGA